MRIKFLDAAKNFKLTVVYRITSNDENLQLPKLIPIFHQLQTSKPALLKKILNFIE